MNDNVYIKSRGFTETQVNNNIRGSDWIANYDGNIANLSMNIHNNNSNEHVELKMDNKQLSELFNFPVIQGPIDERLQAIYLPRKPKIKPNILIPIPYVVNPPISHEESVIFTPNNEKQSMSPLDSLNSLDLTKSNNFSQKQNQSDDSIPRSRNYLTSPALNDNYYPVTQTHYRSSGIPFEKTEIYGGKRKTKKYTTKRKKRTRISTFLRRYLK
jgi:hypothetical protein